MSRSSALRRKWEDQAEDVVLVEQARELQKSGEIAFLFDVADAAENLVPNEPQQIASWANRNVFIPASKTTRGGMAILSAIQRGWAEALQEFGTEVVVLLKGPRVGASTFTAIVAAYYSAHEQSDVLIYERTDKTGQEYAKEKLMPIFRASVALRVLLRPDGKTGEQDTWDNRELHNGAGLKIRSASNDNSFKGVRGRMIICEECGDGAWQPAKTGSEGTKLDLAMRRGQEFGDGRVFLSGTPTVVGSCLISAEFAKTDKRVFMMDCPHCRHRQEYKPDVRRVHDKAVPYGPGLRYLLNDKNVCTDAWYECANPECEVRCIDETYKSSMMATGRFEATCVGERGKVGLFVWMAHSEDPKATWKHIGEAHDKLFVRGVEEEKKSFVTMFLAQPFSPTPLHTLDPTALESRKEDWATKDGEVVDAPEWALAAFRSIDVQRGRKGDEENPPRVELFTHVIGPNRRRAVVSHETIAGIWTEHPFTRERQFVHFDLFSPESVDLIHAALEKEIRTADGRTLRHKWCFVDTSDNPEDAHRFCKMRKSVKLGVIPIRGDVTERGRVRKPLLPANTNLVKSARSGRDYLYLGTQGGKDYIARLLQIPAPAPESWVFAADLPRRFFEGLLAEAIDEKTGRWERISETNTGEPLDCMNYSLAAEEYEMRRNRHLRKACYELDQAAVEEAVVVKAELQAKAEKDKAVAATPMSEAVVLGQPELAASDAPPENPTGPEVQAAVEPKPRFRVVKREAPRRDIEAEAAAQREARIRHVRKRQGSTGIGW